MSEKVIKIKLPEGTKYHRVEVIDNGIINLFYDDMCENTISEKVQCPIEGKWFDVNPIDIDQELFLEKRDDPNQEKTRQIILEAFKEMKTNPECYERPFRTKMMEKGWERKSVIDIKSLPEILGYELANWVHQALEWAQRISNGETWENLCNEPDKAKCFRLIRWKDYEIRLVGGSIKSKRHATYIHNYESSCHSVYKNTIPLIMCYNKD